MNTNVFFVCTTVSARLSHSYGFNFSTSYLSSLIQHYLVQVIWVHFLLLSSSSAIYLFLYNSRF